MTEEMGRGLAAICYGLAGALIGGWLYLFDSDGVSDTGSAVVGLSGIVVIYGLVSLGRAFGKVESSE